MRANGGEQPRVDGPPDGLSLSALEFIHGAQVRSARLGLIL